MAAGRRPFLGCVVALIAFVVIYQASAVIGVGLPVGRGDRTHVGAPVRPITGVRRTGPAPPPGLLHARRSLASSTGAWVPAGPRLIDTAGKDPEKWATGRVASLAATPVRGNVYTLYAGTAGGGVWKSIDKGLDWTPLGGSSFQSPIIGAVAVDPLSTSTVYAGTGLSIQQDYGYGVYKSSNGGVSWTLEDGVAHDGSGLFDGRAVTAIVPDRNTTGCPSRRYSCRIYASVVDEATGVDVGVAVSKDAGLVWKEPTGARSLSGDAVTSLITDGHGDLYAGVSAPAKAAGVWYSAFNPVAPGVSWVRIVKGLPVNGTYYQLAINPNTAKHARSSQTVYAAAGNDNEGFLGVFRTTTGGEAGWTAVGTRPKAPYFNPNKDCSTKLAPPPQVPDINVGGNGCQIDGQATFDLDLTAAGNSLYLGQINIFKTDNATVKAPQWYDISNSYANVCKKLNPSPDYHHRTCGVVTHVDQHAALTIPTSPSPTVYFGNDGGVYATPNGGQTLVNANGATHASTSNPQGTAIGAHPLVTTQFYGAGITADGKKILGGTQDNGSIYSTNGGSGSERCAAETARTRSSIPPIPESCTPRAWTPTYTRASTGEQASPMFPRLQTIRCRSSRCWPTQRIRPGCTPDKPTCGARTTVRAHGRNIGPTGGTPGISAAAVSAKTTGTVYIGAWDSNTNDGDVWMTRNAAAGSPSWQRLTTTLPGPVTGLAVSPTNPDIVYASLNNFNSGPGGFVFEGVVSGTVPHAKVHWSNITHNLPNITYYTVAVDQVHPRTLYAGGYSAAFVSTDDGTSWKRMGTALPVAEVFQFVQAHGRLYAFTYGRGAYSIPLPVS